MIFVNVRKQRNSYKKHDIISKKIPTRLILVRNFKKETGSKGLILNQNFKNSYMERFWVLKSWPFEVEFQIPHLGGTFGISTKCIENEISKISRWSETFRWLEFEILIKETWHFKCQKTRCHIISKKTHYSKFLSRILVPQILVLNSVRVWSWNL